MTGDRAELIENELVQWWRLEVQLRPLILRIIHFSAINGQKSAPKESFEEIEVEAPMPQTCFLFSNHSFFSKTNPTIGFRSNLEPNFQQKVPKNRVLGESLSQGSHNATFQIGSPPPDANPGSASVVKQFLLKMCQFYLCWLDVFSLNLRRHLKFHLS